MIRKFAVAMVLGTALSTPSLARPGYANAAPDGEDTIVVTAARSILPANALPLTIDVIGKEALDQQLAISGSVTDAVATLTPSRSEEHTSELQSLMRISYAVFCLKKKKITMQYYYIQKIYVTKI